MPVRREHRFDKVIGFDARILARWETERDVVGYAVLLLAEVDGDWRPVVLFDCSHGDRNDRHRYSFDGVKGPAEVFHHGTPGEGMRAAIALIFDAHARMIATWRR